MRHTSRIPALAAVLGIAQLPSPASAQGPSPSCHDLAAVTAIAQDAMARVPGLPGLGLRVAQGGQEVYQRAFGSYTLQQNVPLYSASKPLSAAVLLALVDQGRLQLDDPVSTYLPEFARAPYDAITLRMCFAHTSGLPYTSPWIFNTGTTLRIAARNLASAPLDFAPGTKFAYGNTSMHVAGAACEVATGKTWAQLFDELIAQPLGLASTDYTGAGVTDNPRIAGGARSDLRDYGRFLEMLRGRGTSNGTRVLSQAAVDAMLTDHTSHLPIHFSPNPSGGPYGLGVWIDQTDSAGRTTHVSSPGFGGFTGWLDLARGVTGVVLANNNGRVLYPYFERVVGAVDTALLPVGVQCLGAASPVCATATRMNTSTWPRAGLPTFSLHIDEAPASGLGALLVSASATPQPLRWLDMLLWVQAPAVLSVGVIADVDGRVRLPVALTGASAGQSLALQSVWSDPTGCGGHGLRASQAIGVEIQH